MPPDPKLIDKLSTRLPVGGRVLLDAARRCADEMGLRLFLVGGTVRDILLDRDSIDVDIAVEGDAVALAHRITGTTKARLAKTTEFGTATIRSGTFVLDLATTRAETYARPGALPKVRPSTLDDDLHRRDFTINAVALEIAGQAPGKLYDPTGGVADLRAGILRVLHDRSFRDDATRIIRAARYETRFGFHLEQATHDLLRRDLGYLDSISGTRVRQELDRTFREGDAAKALARMQSLGVLRAIHPALDSKPEHIRAIAAGMPSAVCWAILAYDIDAGDVPGLIKRCALTRKQAAAVQAIPHLRALSQRLQQRLRASEIDELLAPFPEDALVAFATVGGAATAALVREYLERTRSIRPLLRGDELIGLGIPRGPEVADVLNLLRAARLDGVLTSREDEAAFVRDYLAMRKRAAVV